MQTVRKTVVALIMMLLVAFTLTACEGENTTLRKSRGETMANAQAMCVAKRNNLARAKSDLARSLLNYEQTLGSSSVSAKLSNPPFREVAVAAASICSRAEKFIRHLGNLARGSSSTDRSTSTNTTTTTTRAPAATSTQPRPAKK